MSNTSHSKSFGPDVCVFLDKYHTLGKLSKTGTFMLTEPIGAVVPYDILPSRIKRQVNMMPLDRLKFPSTVSYHAALLNLYTYGYMPQVDMSIIDKTRTFRKIRKDYCSKPTYSRKKADLHQLDRQSAWLKANEDMKLYREYTECVGSIGHCL